MPRPDLARLADQIYNAIEGLGTDEEAVYRALQVLDRDQALIEELKQVYQNRHHASLIEDIEDDFSGSELEYALQLLNVGRKGSEQTIARGPVATDPVIAANRLWRAFEGLGTDEEAVYAALLPFRRDTLKVQRAYQEIYREDLRDRIEDEMSGAELACALDLMETPYERYMQEAVTWLKRFPAIGFGLPWNSSDWFDGRFWRSECTRDECKLVLKGGKPHEAIDALFHEQGRWRVDCAVFGEVVRLYALRQSLGARRFDARIGSRMELRAHGSTGAVRHVLFKRATKGEAFVAAGPGEPTRIGALEELLGEAPVGSRVRWTSTLPFDRANNLSGEDARVDSEGRYAATREEWYNYQHENTIKLGPDRYGAQGVGGARVTRADIEQRLIEITADALPGKPQSEIRAGIFISEIEIFDQPALSEQIEPTAADSDKGPRP